MSVQTCTNAEPIAALAGVPLVSVVIPTRNRARLLERALKSALGQTHEHLELLVVDDASTDGTAEIVSRFGDARIRYLRQEQSCGGAAARNIGIRAAAGSYIAFLDDDDEWQPTKIAEQLKLLRRYDVVLCGYSMDREAGAHALEVAHGPEERLTADDFRAGFSKGGSASALIASASALKETLFDESLPRCQDWDLCIRLAQRYSIGYTPLPLVKYNDGDHGRISNRGVGMPAAQMEQDLRMLVKHRDYFGRACFERHMCSLLLYGFRRRRDKLAHIGYIVRRYGFRPVAAAFLYRLREKLRVA